MLIISLCAALKKKEILFSIQREKYYRDEISFLADWK